MLEELYQQVILDHSRSPRNATLLQNPSCSAHGHNPMCGDELWCTLTIEENIVTEIGFKAQGCAISVASASLMGEVIKHKTLTEVEELFQHFHQLVTEGTEKPSLGKLTVLAGVKQFPMRVKCATLAWHTLKAAIEKRQQATTEGCAE